MAPTEEGEQPASSSTDVKEYKLVADQELRFEVDANSVLLVELTEGTCEMFGTELVQHKRYEFGSDTRGALFTWHGCTVELVGSTDSVYVSKQTPMIIYLNTHAALEQMRQHVESDILQQRAARGPRLMIAGPTDVGKSTYCRILLNYAVRQGRSPTFVDLDVGQGSGVNCLGTVGALFVERPADVLDGFDRKVPLVYHFGHLSPGDNIQLYNHLVTKMSEVVNDRCKSSTEANVAGVIINTCGWVKGQGYQCLVHAAEQFEVEVVVVLDHERLFNDLQHDLPSFVKIIHQPKSGGVEERSRPHRIRARAHKAKTYFYGVPSQPFYPHTFQLKFDEFQLVKIGAPELPDSCLPLGTKQEDTRTKVVSVVPSAQLQHHLLGVSMCESLSDAIVDRNVAGFVCVTEVDMENSALTVLSPQPYPLPRKILIYGDVTYMDDK